MRGKLFVMLIVAVALVVWSEGCGSKKKDDVIFGTGTAPTGTGTNPTGTGTNPTGTGGTTTPFATPGAGSGQVSIYTPSSYNAGTATPVIFLFNEFIPDWKGIADAQEILIVDLEEYADVSAYGSKYSAVFPHLEANYNVDVTRVYWAGWSAGGNIVIQVASDPANQPLIAATMVFPGTGGQPAYNNMSGYSGHKIRLFYSCGSDDENYGYGTPVQSEATTFAGLGYTTTFELVTGSGHKIDEGTYHIRQTAWDWVKGFTTQN
ncbi:MAG: hypothetical protein ACYS8W_12415 [Planctomycetota bacterium]|jgi:dienelactone hydrolase